VSFVSKNFMEQKATKLSPLFQIGEKAGAVWSDFAGWQVAEQYGDTAAEQLAVLGGAGMLDLSAGGKVIVQGDQAATTLSTLPATTSLAINEGAYLGNGVEVYRLRSDQFIFLTPPGGERRMIRKVETAAQSIDGLITVTDLTHGRAWIGLVGPRSAELLSRLCSLDFHPSSFPKGTAKQTSVARTTQLVVCHTFADKIAYSVIGGRSLAVYLWETILTVGRDLGMRPVGVKLWPG
jgi:heterotetrameric sarcosine oxidase gamma subunit